MITRYALFEGTVTPGQEQAFRDAVLAEILPVWRRFRCRRACSSRSCYRPLAT